MANGSSI
jgi:hypothetical protein